MNQPFVEPESERPRVFVAGNNGPYENTAEALAGIDLSPARGKKVLLKPNAGRVDTPNSGIVTNPQVVAAAIDLFRKAGAEVAVGESPITGVNVFDAFDASGIAEVARDRDCPLIDLDKQKYTRVEIPGGKAIDHLLVCSSTLAFDIIVSIPVMKMHMHTVATLSVKNMKGCLWARSKVDLHMLPDIPNSSDKPLDVAIADLSSVLRPHLAIIDGTIGMEGLGPSAGEPKALDVIVAGINGFAADAVACRLMGISAEDVPHLRIAAQRGYGLCDLDAVDILPTNWERFIQPFCGSPDILSLSFPDITIHDKNSCSACQSTLLLFLKRYGHILFDYFPQDTPLHIAIGKGHESLPDKCLCIGNCTRAHKENGIFVPGCPPVGSAILKKITGMTHLPGEVVDR